MEAILPLSCRKTPLMATRTITECEQLAALWLTNSPESREAVIRELGSEPATSFLMNFGPPHLRRELEAATANMLAVASDPLMGATRVHDRIKVALPTP